MIPTLFANHISSNNENNSFNYVARSPLSSEAELNEAYNADNHQGYLCLIGVWVWQSQPIDASEPAKGHEWRNTQLTSDDLSQIVTYTNIEIDAKLIEKESIVNKQNNATQPISELEYYTTSATTEKIDSKIASLKDQTNFFGNNATITGEIGSDINVNIPEATENILGVTKVLNELNENSNYPVTSTPINLAIKNASDALKGGVADKHNTLLKLSNDVSNNTHVVTTANNNYNTLDKIAIKLESIDASSYTQQEIDDKDTQAKNRDNHTGTQPIATIETLQSQLNIINASLASKPNNADIGAPNGIAKLTNGVLDSDNMPVDTFNLISVDTYADLPVGDNIKLNALYYADDDINKILYIYNLHISDWQIVGSGSGSGGTSNVNLAITEHSATQFKISNSAGTDVVIAKADAQKAGLLSVEFHNKLTALHEQSELDESFANIASALNTKQNLSEKNQVNGYVGLNSDGIIPTAFLPQKIITVAENLPDTGDVGKVYIVESGVEQGIHLWSDAESQYYPAKPDLDLTPYLNRNDDTLDDITAGSNNLHYTSAINTRLADTENTNTGDETPTSIQNKRPLKTVNDKSLEGPGNVELTTDDVNSITNKRYTTDAQLAKIDSTETGAQANVQSDWNEDDSNSKAYIKNKPSVLSTENIYICGQLVFHVADSVQGCLKFDGVSLYSKNTYAQLYALINNLVGADYDNGDNFYLPNPHGRVIGIAGAGAGLTARNFFEIVGAEQHALSVDEIPSHNHTFYVGGGDHAVDWYDGKGTTSGWHGGNWATTTFDTGGGQAHNNMQPTLFAAQNLFIAY